MLLLLDLGDEENDVDEKDPDKIVGWPEGIEDDSWDESDDESDDDGGGFSLFNSNLKDSSSSWMRSFSSLFGL